MLPRPVNPDMKLQFPDRDIESQRNSCLIEVMSKINKKVCAVASVIFNCCSSVCDDENYYSGTYIYHPPGRY